jgi:hypothetical protein
LIAAAAVCLLLHLCGITSVKKLKPKDAATVSKAALLKEHAPAFFQNFICAVNWTQAQKILDEFCRNTEMCNANLACLINGNRNVVWSWRAELSAQCRRKPQLCKTLKVFHDDVCYQFYFCWDSEFSRMQSDTDALLDVISRTIGKSCHEKFFSSGLIFEKNESLLLSGGGLRLAGDR